jgi:hypothetical protein
MEYVELERCPICGAHPDREKESLGRPGGHGYPGHYTYQYKCEKCKMVKGISFDDVYHNEEAANRAARLSWNEACYKVLGFMAEKNKTTEVSSLGGFVGEVLKAVSSK